MMSVQSTVRHMFVLAALAFAPVACGGGGTSTPTPTVPAPIPASDACNVFGSMAPSGVQILNGAECSPDRSSVVLLNMSGPEGGGQCSGTIISSRAVLTAAHCLDEGVSEVRVWLGPPNPQIVTTSFVYYPNCVFNRPDLYDVGLIFVDEDMPRTPVPILASRDPRPGETAILVGWGRDQNNAGATLRAGSTTLTAVGSSLLETIYGSPASSICSGDSGGPLLVSEGGGWVIAGISSATSSQVCHEGTNYFQSVRRPEVRAFIRQHVPNVIER
jgi:hypothetical protein